MKKLHKASLVALSLTGVIALQIPSAYANTLSELEGKKEQLQQKSEEAANKKSTLENELNNVEEKIQNLESELDSLNETIKKTENEINEIDKNISNTKTEIESLKKEIKKKEDDLNKKKKQLEDTLQLMYSKGDVQFLEFLFRSDSVSQFIYRYEQYKKISDEGVEIHNEVLVQLNIIKEKKELVVEKQKKLEIEKSNLEKQKKLQIEQKNQQKDVQKELNQERKKIEHDIAGEEDAMNALSALIVNAERSIGSEKSRIAEARKRAENERNRSSAPNNSNQESKGEKTSQNTRNTKVESSSTSGLGNGTLASPLKSGTYRLSSHYGYRIHPITGKRKLHNGTDFAAPRNTPIYAMEDGYVLYAGAASGYGNWIVIKHESLNLYTIYGHMYDDGVNVRPGQYVFRGQKIGGVGSNGGSTGNHLHFCVSTSFSGGVFNYQNPLNYINR